MVSYNVLKKKMVSLLKKFKLDEIEALNDKDITSITVDEITQVMCTFNLHQTVTNIAEAFMYLYEMNEPTVEEFETTLYGIFACDLALHNNRKNKWAAVSMEREVKDLPNTLEDLNVEIQNAYEAAKQDYSVKAYTIYEKKVVWTVLVPKMKKRGLSNFRTPIFFAYKPSLDFPHFLFSPPMLKTNLHLEIYMGCLGYKGYSLLDYEGTDVIDMFSCIDKENEPLPVNLPAEISGVLKVREKEGIIYDSKAVERQIYAQNIFFSNAHQYFKAECDGTLLDCSSNTSKRDGSGPIEFLSSVEFITSGKTSVEGMLKHLVSIGATSMPVPEYMLQISSTPSNFVTFHASTVLSLQDQSI